MSLEHCLHADTTFRAPSNWLGIAERSLLILMTTEIPAPVFQGVKGMFDTSLDQTRCKPSLTN